MVRNPIGSDRLDDNKRTLRERDLWLALRQDGRDATRSERKGGGDGSAAGGLAFVGGKGSTNLRRDTEDAEEIRRNASDRHLLGLAAASEIQ
jgi:hypothetical protein